MSVELKIKSKHLALEPAIIKKEKYKLIMQENYSSASKLHEHCKHVVRPEARATFLARAFLSCVPYSRVELKRKPEKENEFKSKVLPRVIIMIQKYGHPQYTKEDVLCWLNNDNYWEDEDKALDSSKEEQPALNWIVRFRNSLK